MKYTSMNNLLGWIVCLIACTVYLITMEPTVSLWDTGEFIAAGKTIGIPHPPGAPLFILIGRFFIILFGDSPHTAAIAMNSLSALASGFTILFLFWTITHFARKMVQKNEEALNRNQVFIIMSAGVVGALAYTFSDSFWYSAVEGEVYALSSFFTAIAFWSILKWEQQAHKPGADRWLVFIFYLMGLSIGVHLLNLLAIPAIVMVYYFKRFKITRRGIFLAFVASLMIFGFVMKFVIQFSTKTAAWFDLRFVNDLGMPFFSGFAFFFVLLGIALLLGIRYAIRKRYYYLKLGLLSTVFMIVGYSTYFTTMVRSNADPGVDMFNVDNPVSLKGYLGREQYGDWPILYGPDFTDRAPYVPDGNQYVRGKNKYIVAGKNYRQDWSNTPSSHLFPRMWNSSNDRGEVDLYRQYAGLLREEKPTMKDNLEYFIRYQSGWMYWRYFMWNFAGKQNDLQGFGNPRDSNFISGISFIDNAFYGNQSKMPESISTKSKANNKLYMLPLALGVAGLIFQYMRKRNDLLVSMLLFLSTGMAIVFYLNQAGFQPRERDYAYVGSFYAFAIWIGLGVLWVNHYVQKMVKRPAVSGYAAAVLCFFAVPMLMAQQEWDDHDRSGKTLALDMAKNYLESCPPNALLFTFEDTDTYPLWYAQEVEGIRRDVRVMVSTLIGTDWYSNQLRYKINGSAPFDMVFTPEQFAGDRLNVAYFDSMPGFDQNKYYDLRHILKDVIASDDTKYTQMTEDGDLVHLFPVRKFSVPVDQQAATDKLLVLPGEKVVPELQLDLGQANYILKNDLTLLSVIAANNWKRPICFTNTGSLGDLGLDKYTRLEGLVYRLVPVENPGVNHDVAYKNVLNKFGFGGAHKKNVYFDGDNRRSLNIAKRGLVQVAVSLANAGRKEEARRLLQLFDQKVRTDNVPYAMASSQGNMHNVVSLQFLEGCFVSGEMMLAKKVSDALKKDLRQQMDYYMSLGDDAYTEEQLVTNAYLLMDGKPAVMSGSQRFFITDILSTYQILQRIAQLEKEFEIKPNT
jgi:hypothetical protein